ncbi:MAG TPA: hypothetical protein VJ578_06415 [Dehalococcoidia bacterium]|nr:hypothetical protein [Dehalococcoidia bacterium]
MTRIEQTFSSSQPPGGTEGVEAGGLELQDLRELDVSGLGEAAFGFALTFELPQVGAGDGQWVFFGRGSLMAMVMTMSTGGGAPADAVPLAEVMDGRIKGLILE